MHTNRRSNRLAVTIAAVAAIAVSFLPSTASADQAKLGVSKVAWYWMSNSKVTGCVGAGDLPSSPTTGVCGGGSLNSGVFGNFAVTPLTPGHFGVAMKNGDDDMRSFVHVDIPEDWVPSRVILKLTVALPTDAHAREHAAASGRAPATFNQENAAIEACPVKEFWVDNISGGGGGDPVYSTKIVNPKDSPDGQLHVESEKSEPKYDCGTSVPGVQAKDGSTWTFDLSSLAKSWNQSNDGVVLVPVEKSIASSWTVEFHGPQLTLQGPASAAGDSELQYVKASDAPVATVEYSAAAPSGPSYTPPTSGGTSPILPSFNSPLPPPPFVLGTDTVAPTQNTGGPALVATRDGSIATPAWVLALIPLLMLGAGLLSNAIGSDPLGLAVAGARSRVASVLQRRRMGGEGVAAGAEAIQAAEEAGPTGSV